MIVNHSQDLLLASGQFFGVEIHALDGAKKQFNGSNLICVFRQEYHRDL